MEDTDRTEPDPIDEEIVREETEKAAEEAARIGGPGAADDDLDEAERPLVEAGEGSQEGFEEAERELIEHASHGDEAPSPESLAGEPEADRADVEFGEPDQIESTERPEEGLDDRERPDEPPSKRG
jgi:hypothetical protein